MKERKMTKEKWYEVNGFSNNGITYLVLGNSYPIKDQLKDIGFKYSPLLGWHGNTKEYKLPSDCSYLEASFNEFFEWSEEQGVAFMKENARQRLAIIFETPKNTKSTFVGEVGNKICDIYCKIKSVGGYDTFYGYRWVYNFIDENDNEFSWHSTTNKALSEGMYVNLSGTIKEHKEYHGVKITILTRCKVQLT